MLLYRAVSHYIFSIMSHCWHRSYSQNVAVTFCLVKVEHEYRAVTVCEHV